MALRCVTPREAARLAKADLVTLMVREFTELQGVMGGIYLAAEGAPERVATAVRWQYHPIAVEPEAEPAPAFVGKDAAARVFAAVALADKLDTLAGYFGLGENPTGSRDPFGLRRAGQGAVRAVLDFWRPKPGEKTPDLAALLGVAIGSYGPLEQPADATARAAEAFLLDRLEYVLSARGFSADEVAAVVYAPDVDGVLRHVRCGGDEPARAARPDRRARSCRRAAAGAARGARRLRGAGGGVQAREEHPRAGRPRRAGRSEPVRDAAEQPLFDAVSRLAGAGRFLRRAAAWPGRTAGARGRFFDDVLVMAAEPQRGNRLALLSLTLSLFYRIADISKLGG